MISISKYWKQRIPDENGALRRALGLLLQSLEIHTVLGDEVDYAQFRSGMQGILSRFSDETPPEEVLIIVAEAVEAFREYSERTTRYRKAQAAEYQQMVAMFTDTITATSHASDRTVGRLQDIERKIERAAVIEDVRVLRMQLNECLESIREEIRCQESERSASKSQMPEADPASSTTKVSQVQETDAVTGLPGRAAAERALEEARTRGGQWYAVAVIANRLASINSRFGYGVGDRLLRKLSDGVRAGLSAEDRVFRWSGPCLVALLLRTTPEHELRTELQRITSAFKEDLVEIGNRSVLLPMSAIGAVFPLKEPTRVICEKIDGFVGSQSADY
jgi:diguanylate cyclase (GGDEF)-like protein